MIEKAITIMIYDCNCDCLAIAIRPNGGLRATRFTLRDAVNVLASKMGLLNPLGFAWGSDNADAANSGGNAAKFSQLLARLRCTKIYDQRCPTYFNVIRALTYSS